MFESSQKTIKESVQLEGVGLHNGIKVNLSLIPAEVNSGITFKRKDIDDSKNIIEASYKNVSASALCTKIKNSHDVSVSTIEHLMGSLYGIGIDNALIEIDNEEVPILDGSAKIFIEKILSAGIKTSDVPIKIIKIENEVKFSLHP
jgi:UDP-3-O-[3-hydroxymyristoyl] N-acetylglucosamine deacetylase